MLGLFIISIILSMSTSEALIDNGFFAGILGVCFLVSVVMNLIFMIGMSYNAYKIKRFGWMFSVLILGDIFMIIFYFSILKKEWSNIKKGEK